MEIERIKNELRKQNNRATALPIFVVEEAFMIAAHSEYQSSIVETYWVYTHDTTLNAKSRDAAEKIHKDFELPGKFPDQGWEQVPMAKHWRFVTACFTEKGCREFLELDGHNHGETRIYVYSGRRNREFETIRAMLMEEN